MLIRHFMFSRFTISLLRDTGYYSQVSEDFTEEMFFGRGQGCRFVEGTCEANGREFCSKGGEFKCDFYNYGVS